MKRNFFCNSIIFYLLLAGLVHVLSLLLPVASSPAPEPAQSQPVTITYNWFDVKSQLLAEQKTGFPSRPEASAVPLSRPAPATLTDRAVSVSPGTSEPVFSRLPAVSSTQPVDVMGTAATDEKKTELLSADAPVRQAISARLKEALIYPPLAKKRGLEGQAVVLFELDEAGQLKQVQLVKSSGHVLLDNEALAAVHRVVPFKHGLGDSICLQLPLNFELKKIHGD
jgi:TonB family protein